MNRQQFAASNLKDSPIPMGTKCYVSLQAMCKKLRPQDMDTKCSPRYYGSAYGVDYPTVQFSNYGHAVDYNAAKDSYKVLMSELTNSSGHRTIWVDSQDLDFAI